MDNPARATGADNVNNGNVWNRSVSILQAGIAVVTLLASMIVAVGQLVHRVAQHEWELKAIHEQMQLRRVEDDGWKARVDGLLMDIRDRLARIEEKTAR